MCAPGLTTTEPMDDSRKIPRTRFGRFARLAGVGARAGVGFLGKGDGQSTARKAAEVLGNLRGVATKVGQMASYVDGVVPPHHREAYERWMKGLQATMPPSATDEIHDLVASELGAAVGDIFAEWEDVPIASASIGQVHAARLADGRRVAVKVQHPGIVDAVEADLRNAGLVEGALSMLGARKFDSKGVLDVVRTRFREELDYRHEAKRQKQFQALHACDPLIRIPEVIDELSSKRVLTTQFIEGLHLDEAMQAPVEARRQWIETLWRFVYRGTLVGRIFNADPHPGNYFFHDDGAITFIDFGCVQEIGDVHGGLAADLHRAAILDDEDRFRRTCMELFHTQGGDYEAAALTYVRSCFEPHFGSPYRITRPYVTELVDEMKRMVRAFRRTKDDGFVPLPPEMFFLNRLQFGFYSVVARLDAEVDYATVERTFLDVY